MRLLGNLVLSNGDNDSITFMGWSIDFLKAMIANNDIIFYE